MKYLIGLIRILVGVLFIISGFVKLNDPIGFSIKLTEYFSEEVLNITFLEPLSLWIALFVVIYEILLGVFLLIGYKTRLTLWGLLLMIIFFSFLTFYSAYFNKVTDCGCFGDAIKLTPWESFSKDIVLLVLILILFAGKQFIKPLFNKAGSTLVSIISLVACIWFANHVINHLPSLDFRPYKVGANIKDGMIIPEDAPKPVVEYYWKFNVDGKEEIFTTSGSYPEVEGEFVSVETEVIKEGYEPPIHDFSIERNGEDYTDTMLDEENLILIVSYDLEKAKEDGMSQLKELSDEAYQKGYKVIGMTASGVDIQQQIKDIYELKFDFYFCDETALKTIVRSNPGILKLNKGTVIQKVHWNDIEDVELPEVERNVILNSKNVKTKKDKILYLVNDRVVSEEKFEKINSDSIESVNVIKDTIEIKKYSKDNYDGVIRINLKS